MIDQPLSGADPGDLLVSSIRVIETNQDGSGAFVASPTFSQYGYSWFRDGAFIAEALDLAGRFDAASRFHRWVAGVILAAAPGMERAAADALAGRSPSPEDYLECRYGVDGSRSEDEWPTFQLDGPGIWLWSLAHHVRHGGEASEDMRAAAGITSRYLADMWTMPCNDAWEEFADHVHTSTLAAIRVGLTAGLSIDPSLDEVPSIGHARRALDERFEGGSGPFTKWQGSDAVDASLLWMVAPYGSVDAADRRMSATLERIEQELVSPGMGVHRYAADTYYGGGAWPVLASALGRVLLRRGEPGDRDRATAALAWIEEQAAEDGWLPEQVSTHALAPERIDEWRRLWGESANPLLWSHAAYVALRVELGAGVAPSA